MAFLSSISGTHELVFDDRPTTKKRYTLNGVVVPGVTTLIKAGLPTPEPLQNWKIGIGAEYVLANPKDPEVIKNAKQAWKKESEEAASIGIVVHDYAELVSLKKPEEALEMLAKHEGSAHWGGILAAVHKVDEFNKENEDEILFTETLVASPKYKFAGRFDRLVRRNGKVIISDYKTSKSFYVEQFIQDAAYSIAISEWLGIEVEGFEVLRFGKEGGDFEPLLIDSISERMSLMQQALTCLDTYKFMKEWNKDPRFDYRKQK